MALGKIQNHQDKAYVTCYSNCNIYCLLYDSKMLLLNHLNCVMLLEKIMVNYNIDLLAEGKKMYNLSLQYFFVNVFLYYKSPLPFS